MKDDLRKFLLGEAPLEGVWFGDRHPEKQDAFWWRAYVNKEPDTSALKRDLARLRKALRQIDWCAQVMPERDIPELISIRSIIATLARKACYGNRR